MPTVIHVYVPVLLRPSGPHVTSYVVPYVHVEASLLLFDYNYNNNYKNKSKIYLGIIMKKIVVMKERKCDAASVSCSCGYDDGWWLSW